MNKNLPTIFAVIFIIGIIWFAFYGKNSENSQSTKNIQNQDDITVSNSLISPEVGKIFPDFSFVDIDRKNITRDSIKGKITLLWFTTSWCVPCQIGAKKVAALDDDLGGNAFDVVVIFVDPREKESDLKGWRDEFGNSDWTVTFDDVKDPLSKRIGLKFLDSKYLIDKSGTLKDIDFKIANQEYLDLISSMVNNG